MNVVTLVGRLTRDPDIKYTNGGMTIARFSVAVDRRFKSEGGPTADFPNCVAFGKTAEFIEKYFSKGKRIGLTGRIQTGSYKDKDGRTVYTTDVVAENVEFVESANSNGGGNGGGQSSGNNEPDMGWANVEQGIDDEMPFL